MSTQTRSGRRISMGGVWLLYTVCFGLLVTVLGLLESAGVMGQRAIGYVFLATTFLIYAAIGIWSRTRVLDEYYVAGRSIPAIYNGMATAADWMSGASFISMAGILYALGYDGMAYIMGWTGGYVLLALLLAPYLRKFGKYTIPDFIGDRFQSNATRVVAVIATVIISGTYLIAQITGVGIVMSRFLQIDISVGVFLGLLGVLFCSFLGGMRAITWTQVAQYIVLIVAYLIPITLLAHQQTGVPLPQLMQGQALQQVTALEPQHGITKPFVEPFNETGGMFQFLALTLSLMVGTAGLPHVLVRFYTVPNVRQARWSVGWALLFIFLLYFTAPAYAAFVRWEILQNVAGRAIDQLPAWVQAWAKTGLINLAAADANANGILEAVELDRVMNTDIVVLAAPEIAGLPYVFAGLVAAGGLAAALSTADGLLIAVSAAISHDLYYKVLNPNASTAQRLMLSRIMVLIVAAVGAWIATYRLALIAQIVAWAFSLAAASLFPVLVLGIWWKRANAKGAMAGIISGLAVTLAYMVANYTTQGAFNILGISHTAAGIFGMPVNFLVAYLVSRATEEPAPEIQEFVSSLRYPKQLVAAEISAAAPEPATD
ncbi:putative sodium symporter protein [Thermaerobacter marianensis DSM 12885]|uniref:Sodium symporter protein n=1 Tax=Thermaerobacter marianensis (strain ATCC 700841 / DSM 12885 / JCM 10246 / 7p75a) TaxID=644966 RepID=E6SGL5_THEM7|nr:sodium:solute symporter family protein [Thermaerobacter marianensis]ADU50561.1 putative sodium symporter protein [Thermaerobacter marianensis DSM 12885]